MRRVLWIIVLFLFVPVLDAQDDIITLPEMGDIPPHAQPIILGETLLNDDWQLFYVFEDNFQVSVGWRNDRAVTALTRVNFTSSSITIDDFVEDMKSHYETLLSNYTPYELIERCFYEDNIILDEFIGIHNETDYSMRYFIWQDDDILWTFGLNFPLNRVDAMDEIARGFQSDFISCADEDGE